MKKIIEIKNFLKRTIMIHNKITQNSFLTISETDSVNNISYKMVLCKKMITIVKADLEYLCMIMKKTNICDKL